MAEYRIDSHKLIYHPHRVAGWLEGQKIYPIYVEVAPCGSCNHRCIFCALDYMGYKPNLLDSDLYLKNVAVMAQKGVKSIMFAGEGEPLLNKNTPELVNRTKDLDIDVSMTTNGVLLNEEVVKECLNSFSWVRTSLNAGTSETYNLVHRGRAGDFEKVLANLAGAVAYKREKQLSTTIGVQLLLIPENQHEVIKLGEALAEIGVDYYSVKPYSKHPFSDSNVDSSFDYSSLLDLENELINRFSDKMKIAFRTNAMKKRSLNRSYSTCWGLPFWAYIDAKARIWACSAYLGNENFCYGDLHEEDFKGIWEGKRRQDVLSYVREEMDISKCREICRLDEINIYLHELKNPGPHVNFI